MAGFSDCWDWTPREIFHRLDVVSQIENERDYKQTISARYAAMSDEKSFEKFTKSLVSHFSEFDISDDDDSVNTVHKKPSKETISALDGELKKLGWI